VFSTSAVNTALKYVCPGTSDLGDVYVSDSLSIFVMVGFPLNGAALDVTASANCILHASFYVISIELCFPMFDL
jgi:hypothetical protein